MSAYAWPLVVLVLGVLAYSLARRCVRLSEQHRRERRAWRSELEGVRAAAEEQGKRVEALEHWRVLLRNRQNGRD